MEDLFDFGDELGPSKIIHIYEPVVGLKGILVVDNVAMGPSVGGLRIAPDVSISECFRLARAMTLKNAAAGLQNQITGPSFMVMMSLPTVIFNKPSNQFHY